MPKRRKKIKRYRSGTIYHRPDFWLIALVLLITVFGLVMVANVSAPQAFRDFGDKYHYLRLQLRWVAIGIIAFLFTSLFPYQKIQRLTPWFLLISFLGLILVLVTKFGFEASGARRWLTIGGVNFQPSELVKLAFIVYLSAFLSKKKRILPLIFISALVILLVMLQPDLGTTVVIISSGFIVYFVSGAPWWHIFLFLVSGFIGGSGLVLFSPYRKERLLTFLDPFRDPLGASYHIRQVLIALGSGGVLGLGLGQSRQKYEYLPAVTTDSIFAVIAEELGFVGATVLIISFVLLVCRGFKIARTAPDYFGQLLATGIISWIGVQVLVNLAAMVVLVPLTGIPLPFISYGGSSLLLSLIGAGILVNISRQTG